MTESSYDVTSNDDGTETMHVDGEPAATNPPGVRVRDPNTGEVIGWRLPTAADEKAPAAAPGTGTEGPVGGEGTYRVTYPATPPLPVPNIDYGSDDVTPGAAAHDVVDTPDAHAVSPGDALA